MYAARAMQDWGVKTSIIVGRWVLGLGVYDPLCLLERGDSGMLVELERSKETEDSSVEREWRR